MIAILRMPELKKGPSLILLYYYFTMRGTGTAQKPHVFATVVVEPLGRCYKCMDMRVKLRYVLPAAQMALTVGLLWWTHLWWKTVRGLYDMPGTAPAFKVCISVNAPIALIRAVWFRYVSTFGDSLALVLSVGALWYWVGLNVEAWRRERSVLMFRWAPLRLGGDALLIVMGAFWGFTFVAEARYFRPRPWDWSAWLWASGILVPLLIWSVVLVFFFGRDFVSCLSAMRNRPSEPAQSD
jgi:hypothetical protein